MRSFVESVSICSAGWRAVTISCPAPQLITITSYFVFQLQQKHFPVFDRVLAGPKAEIGQNHCFGLRNAKFRHFGRNSEKQKTSFGRTLAFPQPDMSPCRLLYCSGNILCKLLFPRLQSWHVVGHKHNVAWRLSVFKLDMPRTLCTSRSSRIMHRKTSSYSFCIEPTVANSFRQLPHSDSLGKFDGIQPFLLIRNQLSILRCERRSHLHTFAQPEMSSVT